MNAYQRVVDKLRDHGGKVREIRPGQAMAQCPAHEDGTPSLSIAAAGDKVLLYCHGNCEASAVLAAVGLTMADLSDKPPTANGSRIARGTVIGEYVYADASGKPLYSKQRLDPKDFRQLRRLPGGRIEWGLGNAPRVLYRLPELIAAIAEGKGVYICEGEKDVEAVINAGATATTCTEGAWQPNARPKWRQ